MELSTALRPHGVNVDRAGIAKMETGKRCVLDFEVLAISKVLGVGAGKLLGR